MKPLQSVAMGLVIVALHGELAGGYDVFPDPLGWVLVLLGVRDLPRELHRRRKALGLALIAAAVSIPMWLPAVHEPVQAAHPSLLWAVNLPQVGFAALLCHVLASRAKAAGGGTAAGWLRFTEAAFVVVALLPAVVFGGGFDGLEGPSYLAAAGVLLLLVWLLFSYAARPWAGAEPVTRG